MHNPILSYFSVIKNESGFGPEGLRKETTANVGPTGPVNWSDILNKPNTLTGYGVVITANDLPSIPWSKITDVPQLSSTVAWQDIQDKPTTLAGYGVTLTETDIPDLDWSKIKNTPTTVSGYGVTLTESDIPQINWTKIKDAPAFLTSVTWQDVQNKPNTLTGYGVVITADDLPSIPWSKITDTPTLNGIESVLSIKGKLYTYPFTPIELYITDYDVKRTYTVTAEEGNIYRTEDVITYIPPSYSTTDTITITSDGVSKTYDIEIRTIGVQKPSITYPTNGQLKLKLVFTASSSEFAGLGDPQTHKRSEWQVSESSDFSNNIVDITSSTNLTSLPLPTQLDQSKTYFIRVRHEGSISGWSDWSDPVAFTTASNTVSTPSILYPALDSSDISLRPLIKSSAFQYEGQEQSNVASSWQISTDENFTTLVADIVDSTTSLTTYLHNNPLSYKTTYYVRVKHKGSLTGYSDWSNPVKFTTADINGFLVESNNASQNTKFLDNAIVYEDGTPYIIVVGSEQTTLGSSKITLFVMKTDLTGKVLWKKIYDPFNYYPNNFVGVSIAVENNIPYIYIAGQLVRTLTSANRNAIVVKMSVDGSIVWSRVMSRAENYNVGDITTISTSTGTQVFLFSSITNTAGTILGMCYDKLDQNGNYIKSTQLNIASLNLATPLWISSNIENGTEYIYSLAARRTSAESYTRANLTKLDKDLNVIWTKLIYANPYSVSLVPSSFLINEENGTNYIYMSYGGNTRNSSILKMDALFNVSWIRQVTYSASSATEYISGMALHKKPDGDEILIMGTVHSSGNRDSYLTKIKTDGSIMNNIILSGGYYETPYTCSVVNTNEPVYIGVGSSGSIAANNNYPSGFLLRTNKDFNFITSILPNSTHLTLKSTNLTSNPASDTSVTIVNETVTVVSPAVTATEAPTSTPSNSNLSFSLSLY